MRAFAFVAMCLLLPLGALGADVCTAPKQQDVDVKKTPIPMCLVAQKVAATLNEYNASPGTAKDALPSLSKVEFDFKTVSSSSTGLKFNILVFSIGATNTITNTNDVTFGYAVPVEQRPPGLTLNAYVGLLERRAPPKPRDFSAELIQTLQQAAQEVKVTDSVGAAKFKTLTVSLAYGATWDFSGSGTAPISLTTLSGTLDHNRADTQTVKLTFENPPPPTSKTVGSKPK
jgi:hypothetical protein